MCRIIYYHFAFEREVLNQYFSGKFVSMLLLVLVNNVLCLQKANNTSVV